MNPSFRLLKLLKTLPVGINMSIWFAHESLLDIRVVGKSYSLIHYLKLLVLSFNLTLEREL